MSDFFGFQERFKDLRKRGFEVVEGYEAVVTKMPQRATKKSAGYDIRSIQDVVIAPNAMVAIETGVKAFMLDDEELQLRPRSGTAYSSQITLQNAPGTIDADYYDTGKQIKVLLRNEGRNRFEVKAGDRICQGVFAEYLITDDDCPLSEEREDGFGSTGKE